MRKYLVGQRSSAEEEIIEVLEVLALLGMLCSSARRQDIIASSVA